MMLHSTMRLFLSDDTAPEMHPYCQAAMETYITLCEQLYGHQFLYYNVQSLLHIVDDAENLGNFDSCSEFVYENNMPEFS